MSDGLRKRSWREALRRVVGPLVRPPSHVEANLTVPVGDDGAVQLIAIDYPVTPDTRQTWRPHPRLAALVGDGHSRYRRLIEQILELRPYLGRIPAEPEGDEPGWNNGWLPALDAAALYTILATTNPATYIEIGSGNSSKFARRAIRDHGLRTRLVSIDPAPRAEVDKLCDHVVRAPLEGADLSVFDGLTAGDVVFLDGSHRVFTNSDTTVALLEVLPRLPGGALFHVHDIYLPWDYPNEWRARWYSEQYLLAAWLLGGSPDEVLWPSHHITIDPDLSPMLAPLWAEPSVADAEHLGVSFWLRRT